jgi:cyclophilin family peptidyl-prolyl cis-trans isomerase/HEAT repeat protein
MADGRTLDTTLTDSALTTGARWVRAQAARAIGQVHGRARAAALRTLLTDKDTAVAANAAYALGLMLDTASIEALATALRSAPTIAIEAAWSLGELGAPAREAIERALEAPPKASGPRAALLRAAGRLRPVPVALIAPSLSVPDAELRAAATYAIARNRAKDGVRALFPLVRDPDPLVRALVANAFAKALTGDSLGPAARDALHRFMGDRDHLVRTNAVRALATHGENESGPVLGAFADPAVNVRVAAAQSVRFVLRTESAEWDRLWADDTTFMVRRELLAAAARTQRAIPAAASWATDSAWRRRAAFASAEGARAPLTSRPAALEPFLKDADARVRAEALQQLAGMVDSANVGPLPRERVASFLTDRDAFVRAAALDGLRGAARASEVTAIAQVYRESFEDEAMDARLAALRYIAAAWTRDSVAFGAAERASLAAIPVPAEPLERAELKAVTPLANWKGGSQPVKALAFYDSVVRELVLPAVAGRSPRARIVTERGALTIELFALDAPLTVHNFATLARQGFYKETRFHRVVPNFVAQDGDPRGDGNGGPGYAIRDEFNRRRYRRGSVGMALSGPDTGGSQYFVCHAPQPHLDGHYTVFGQLVGGDAVLDAIVQGDRILRVEMIK